jgi:drug/metabolite transporter (DMT)-like permease
MIPWNDRTRADLALLLVTLFWGLTFPLIRNALQELLPHQFMSLRFTLAALVFLPVVLLSKKARGGLRGALIPGLLLGLLAWSSYFSQAIGLQSTGAGRAAFITGTSVIIVPFLSPLFRAGRPSRGDILAALAATGGMYLLTDPSGGGIRRGDLWILVCAFTYAIYIHCMQKVLARRPSEVALAFLQIAGVAIFAGAWWPVAGGRVLSLGPAAWIALLFCALFATVGTFWLQARFQGRTTPERVALIFAMEPVFAAIFAYWILAETLALLSVLGAAIILASVVVAELSN